MVDHSSWSKDLVVDIAGQDVVNHVGVAALRIIADRTGLTSGLSRALARRGFVPVHDRGRVLADTAVLIADGGRVLSDLAMLREQGVPFGPVASDSTLWRALDEIGEPARSRIARARAATREHVWALIEKRHGRIPASRVADRDLGKTIAIRLDASIVIAHSDKQLAAGTFKGTFGHHPLQAWCDNTGESLAVLLRKGNAGSNTASDHIEVLTAAIAQLPARYRRDVLITTDGAGASHDLVDHITTLNARPGYRVHYSIGWETDTRERAALSRVPASAWGIVLDPKDMRIIARREKPHPGAQLSLFEAADGWRYQLLATNTPSANAQFPEARHRPHARVEDSIRTGKQTGLGHLPARSRSTGPGAWPPASAVTCCAGYACSPLDRPLAKAEPKTLRYRTLHTPYPHHPRPAQTQDPHPRHLTLGPATSHLPAHRPRPAPTNPTLINHVPAPDRPSNHPELWNPAPTRHESRAPNLTAP